MPMFRTSVDVLETELKNLVTKWDQDPYSCNYFTHSDKDSASGHSRPIPVLVCH